MPWERPAPNNVAGKGHIEQPGKVANIVWQTRAAAPTAYENALADALEAAFEGGAKNPGDIVRALNRTNFLAADGQPWTEQPSSPKCAAWAPDAGTPARQDMESNKQARPRRV